MSTITTRAAKGTPLTHAEVDANFTNLNADKLDTAGIALGSAASPTIKFTGDVNTGIYSPGADQVAVSTGGAERVRVDSSGRVGIGTSSPSEILDCKGNIILGAQNAASASLQPTSASGTNIAGSTLILRSGRPTGSGSSGEIQILPSNGSTVSGTTVRGNSNSGFHLKFSPTSWNDHPNLGLLTVALGSSTAQANRSGLTGDATVLTIDGLDTSGQSALEIVGSSNSSDGDQGFIRFYGSSSKNPYATIAAVTPGTNYTSGNLAIRTYNAGVEGTVATFTSSGRLLVGTTSAVAAGAKLQTVDGITFPAAKVASSDPNTLDDYEEGTFTPTIIGTGTAGTATYAVQNARYTKTGRMVFIEILLNWSAGTGTGNLRISGLPFTSGSSVTTPSVALTFCSDIATTASHILTARVADNSTQIEFLSYPTGGGAYAIVAYDAAGVVGVAGSYSV